MNVSFYGIKNIGAAFEYRAEPKVLNINGQNCGPVSRVLIPKGQSFELHCELNNKGTKDLTEFKEILKTYPNQDPAQKNVLDIACDRAIFTDTMNNQRSLNICKVNGHTVPMNDENYSVCRKLIKLVQTISEKDEKELTYDKNYVQSESCKKSYPFYHSRFADRPEELKLIFNEFLDPRNIKVSTTLLMSNLLLMMSDSREK